MAGSVAEGRYLDIAGSRQWLLVRGRDAQAPVPLILHGGPGSSETVLFRHFVGAALESRLVVAYWDQRGAGRSYDAGTPPGSMTVERFLLDTDAVVDYLRARLGADRVAVLGHSWGSALGALYAARHPEKVSAYIGVAQIASAPGSEAEGYARALAEARRRNDARGIAELEDIGPPSHDTEAMWTLRRWEAAYGGEFVKPPDRWRLVAWALWTGEASLRDLWRLWRGSSFTLATLGSEARALDVAARVPRLAMPVAFMLGRHDGVVPPRLAVEWLGRLEAPERRLVWFERSAHNPPVEEPGRFAEAVTRSCCGRDRRAVGDAPRPRLNPRLLFPIS